MNLLSSFIVLGGVLLDMAQSVSVQENYTICNWARLRAGVIQDAAYLDGGLLWWQTAFADGTTPVVSSDGNVQGDMFMLNFSTPFDTTKSNVSDLFTRMPKAGGAGNNIAPNYVDGTMFTNDGELYLYGGLPRLTDSTSAQSADSVLGYEADQYGPDRASWSPGFYQGTLPEGVTRYITNGAGVSVPAENMGYYFSGMRSPTWGPIYYEDSSANVTANTLISIDMSTMRDEQWTNTTLPDNITPRANAELVWVPVSDKGVLVAIGGVTSPEEMWPMGLNSTQESTSEAQSPGFMTSLPVYDIASSSWYLQKTSGQAPPQLTEFCSVMAEANDSSSFNIYIYGGYDGLNSADGPSDDVWILSIPSFQWVKGYSGTQSHGRSGHRCVMPYPDQMFVLGGINQNQAKCVEGGIIQVFNLNKLEFQDSYNPETWSDYAVPDILSAAIGGSSTGGSTKSATWSDNALAGIFSKRYANEITHYYPYPVNGSAEASTSAPSSGGGGHGVSKGAIIGIAVAAGIIFILLLILAFLLVRRRKIIRSGSSQKSSGSSNATRVTRWLNGATCDKRPSPQHMESSDTSPPLMQQVSGIGAAGGTGTYHSISSASTPASQSVRHEMGNATELPKPPFEMATEYNNLNQPRHSGIVDYAYNANYGHTHSHSNNSSEEGYRPSPLGNGHAQNAAARGNAYPVTPGAESDVSPPSNENTDTHSSSEYSTSTSDTVPWPLPAQQNTWRANNTPNTNRTTTTPQNTHLTPASANRNNNNPFTSDRDNRSSESSSPSVQPIPEEDEPDSPTSHQNPAAYQQFGGAGVHELPSQRHSQQGKQGKFQERFSYQHPNGSASSGIETLPSPIPNEEGGTGQARNLGEVVSPVSPVVKRFWQE